MKKNPYNRENAVAYAHKWAFGRNPRYYDFEQIGGDCTNFASQVLYAGSSVMNPTPTFGWHYYSINNRTPSWSGVEYLYQFLIKNQGIGPTAVEVDITQAEPGDIVQLSADGLHFVHSPVIVSVGETPDLSNVLVAAHTFDADYRPLDSYQHLKRRFLHITHVNVW